VNPLALFTGPYSMLAKWGVIAALIASFAAFFWYKGDEHGTQKLIDYQGKQATQAISVITRQGVTTERVVTRYVKVKGDTQIVTVTITKEVVRYAEANPGSCLDAGWRLLHNAASANTVPDPGFKPDAAAGAPTATAALETVTGNYAACWRNADRLDALQAWVREQQSLK
jgi:hypothetical protein